MSLNPLCSPIASTSVVTACTSLSHEDNEMALCRRDQRLDHKCFVVICFDVCDGEPQCPSRTRAAPPSFRAHASRACGPSSRHVTCFQPATRCHWSSATDTAAYSNDNINWRSTWVELHKCTSSKLFSLCVKDRANAWLNSFRIALVKTTMRDRSQGFMWDVKYRCTKLNLTCARVDTAFFHNRPILCRNFHSHVRKMT